MKDLTKWAVVTAPAELNASGQSEVIATFQFKYQAWAYIKQLFILSKGGDYDLIRINWHTSGASLIGRERIRQIMEENYTAAHDAGHEGEALIRAAVCYATPDSKRVTLGRRAPIDWPWEADYWKPTPDDRVRELVKAGALIAAEIDRLQKEHHG